MAYDIQGSCWLMYVNQLLMLANVAIYFLVSNSTLEDASKIFHIYKFKTLHNLAPTSHPHVDNVTYRCDANYIAMRPYPYM